MSQHLLEYISDQTMKTLLKEPNGLCLYLIQQYTCIKKGRKFCHKTSQPTKDYFFHVQFFD